MHPEAVSPPQQVRRLYRSVTQGRSEEAGGRAAFARPWIDCGRAAGLAGGALYNACMAVGVCKVDDAKIETSNTLSMNHSRATTAISAEPSVRTQRG